MCGTDEDATERAWLLFRAAVSRIGAYASVAVEDRVLGDAIQGVFGSWIEACSQELSPEMWASTRKAFGRVYRVKSQSSHQGICYLPGLIERENANRLHWQRYVPVGVITAQGVDNPVNDIHSGTFAWSAESGRARVNLSTGATAFEVDGLVINGTAFSGTAGPITQVEGTLVCNAGAADQAVLDTPPVSLSSRGDAEFAGVIEGIPSHCDNPLFLIRIVNPAGALGRWIATGVERSTNTAHNDAARHDN